MIWFSDADLDPIRIIKVGSGTGYVWRDTRANPDPGQICHDKNKLVLQFGLFSAEKEKHK